MPGTKQKRLAEGGKLLAERAVRENRPIGERPKQCSSKRDPKTEPTFVLFDHQPVYPAWWAGVEPARDAG